MCSYEVKDQMKKRKCKVHKKFMLASMFTFSVRQFGSQLWLMKRPKFPLAHASITWKSRVTNDNIPQGNGNRGKKTKQTKNFL